MRKVTLGNGTTIMTPWLRPDAAAAYCGVSRAFFDKRGQDIPHGGTGRTRLFHIDDLDAWVKNGFVPPSVPASKNNGEDRRPETGENSVKRDRK